MSISKKRKTFEEFIASQRTATGDKEKYVSAVTVANQINTLMGFKNVGDNCKKGFVGVAADDPQKGIAGVILFRLKKTDGSPFTEEELKDGTVIRGGTEEETIHIQLPVASLCTERPCMDVDTMRSAYAEAVSNRWPITCNDNPQGLEFAFIVTNIEGRIRYSVPYHMLSGIGRK